MEVYSSSRSLSKRKVWNLQTFAQGRSDTVFNCTVVFKRAFFVSFRNNWNSQPSSNGCNVHISFSKLSALSPVDPVSRKASNFLGQKANFDIKTCWIVAQFQAHKLVNFGSLTDSFIVSFSKLLSVDLECKQQLFGPETLLGLSGKGPLVANQQEINAYALNDGITLLFFNFRQKLAPSFLVALIPWALTSKNNNNNNSWFNLKIIWNCITRNKRVFSQSLSRGGRT